VTLKIDLKQKFRSLQDIYLIAFVAFLLRLGFFIFIGRPDDITISPVGGLFLQGLRDHLWNFILIYGVKPPLNALISGVIAKIFTDAEIYRYDIFLIFSLSCGFLASILFFKTAQLLTKKRPLILFLSLLYSTVLVPFEIISRGRHLDQPTLFLNLLFIFLWIKAFQTKSFNYLIAASISGTVLISQSLSNALIVPMMLFVLLVLNFLNSKELYKSCKIFLAGLLLPILFIASLCVKNQIVSKVPSISTLGGMSRGYFVFQRVLTDTASVKKIMEEIQMPEWYKWCFNNAQSPVNSEGVPYAGWLNFSRAGGLCFKNNTSLEKGCWPFEFKPLYEHLVSTGESEAAGLVKLDMEDSCQRPYLFSGWHPWFTGRWIGYYGKHTEKVLRAILFRYPKQYLSAMVQTHKTFMFQGPGYIQNPPGEQRPHYPGEGNSFWKVFFFLYENIVFYLYVTIPLVWVVIGAFGIYYFKNVSQRKNLSKQSQKFILISTFFMAMHILAFVFCQGASDEHERYFLQATPYLMLLPCMYWSLISYFVNRNPQV
jgi:hypothetical protein